MKLFRWIMGGILVLCSVPLLCVLVAGTVAKLLGCTVNESEVHPCYILGVSIGRLLTVLGNGMAHVRISAGGCSWIDDMGRR